MSTDHQPISRRACTYADVSMKTYVPCTVICVRTELIANDELSASTCRRPVSLDPAHQRERQNFHRGRGRTLMWQLGPGAFGHGIPLGRAFRPEPGAIATSHSTGCCLRPRHHARHNPRDAARTGSVVTGRTGSTRGRHGSGFGMYTRVAGVCDNSSDLLLHEFLTSSGLWDG